MSSIRNKSMENMSTSSPDAVICGATILVTKAGGRDVQCMNTAYTDLGKAALDKFLEHDGILGVQRIEDLRLVKCTECSSTKTLDMKVPSHAKAIVSSSKTQ